MLMGAEMGSILSNMNSVDHPRKPRSKKRCHLQEEFFSVTCNTEPWATLSATSQAMGSNIGALIIRIGFRGPLYCNKEPPK